jgi:hypothetical protein
MPEANLQHMTPAMPGHQLEWNDRENDHLSKYGLGVLRRAGPSLKGVVLNACESRRLRRC